MAYKITWTKTADKQFSDIVNFIEINWNERVSSRFVQKANNIFDLLNLYPEAGSIEVKDKNIRGFLISKQVRLFYRIKNNEIIFLSFFDTRLNPEKKLKRYR